MQDFLTVGQQVLVLFILIAVGFICGRTKIINGTATKAMTDVVMYFATPCVIITSFQRELQSELLRGLLIAFASSLAIHAVSIVTAILVFRDKSYDRQRVLRFAMVFSNAGYMALPLQQAVLGSEGVFYGAVYVAVFNLTVWSWGLASMSGGVKALSWKKLVINPGVIGLVVGVTLFLLQFSLPEVILSPLTHLGNLNTPLPMLIIGYYLSQTDVRAILRDKKAFLCVGLRLVAVPLAALGVMLLCGVRDVVLVSMVIGASAPIAAATTMFATKYEADTSLSVNLVSLSTLLSVVTMPLIVALAKSLA